MSLWLKITVRYLYFKSLSLSKSELESQATANNLFPYLICMGVLRFASSLCVRDSITFSKVCKNLSIRLCQYSIHLNDAPYLPPLRTDFETITQFFPDDSNKLQSFSIDDAKNFEAIKFRVLFGSSTDFFGRITIYSLELYGR